MASGLRAKLNAIGAAAPRAEKKPAHAGGLLRYAHREAADERLFHLDPDGLRRIGWQGRIFDIRRCIFLDTETTGLSGGAGTVAFLVGVGFIEGEDFVVEQYLMRDYADEAELVSQLSERMRDFDCVCSFNGRNFDLPLLSTRFTMCRMREKWRDLEQIDLLYPARRTWKLRLGSCRLCRLEEFILGKPREGDLPGSEVPQRYFDFLKSGNMALLEDIIAHNRQDILTLGTLLAHLCELYAHPERESHRADLFSMGKALEKQGELKPARELYRIAAIPAPAGSISMLSGGEIAAQAAWRMYLLARKNRDWEAMRQILEQMAVRRQCREKIYVELSKLHEHHFGNLQRALRYAELAARYVDQKELEALKRRRERLRQKLEKERGRKRQHGIF
ncbi:MAG: ribonuclease H-like domain-containing protein [Clostridia bacterium]|nr:ribonuclease H-like domain-containing protein [Clostridia bacterium]